MTYEVNVGKGADRVAQVFLHVGGEPPFRKAESRTPLRWEAVPEGMCVSRPSGTGGSRSRSRFTPGEMSNDLITLGVILGVAVITAAATVIYWTKILQWGMGSLLPWVQRYLPELEPAVREAFTYVDSIAVPTYVVVKEAWRNVRRGARRPGPGL